MGSQAGSKMQDILSITINTLLLFLSPSLADLSDSYTAPPAPSPPSPPSPPSDPPAARASYRPSYSAPAKPSYRPSYSAPAPAPSYQTVEVELPDYDYYKHEQHHYYHAGPPRVFHVKVPVTQRPYTVHVPQNVPVDFVPVSVPRQDLPGIQVLEQDPFTYFDTGPPYVQRKELVKGALLLGTGMVKGAILTHLYNQLNTNNNRNIQR